MALESTTNRGHGISPGGFEFGPQGFMYGPPIPKSITFFLDNTAMVCDQYGRAIRASMLPNGDQINFAYIPPEADANGRVVPRQQFASHIKTIEALTTERVDWLAYEVRFIQKVGGPKSRGGLNYTDAMKLQARLIQEGNGSVIVTREIATAGWPQIPYEQLKKLPVGVLPPLPITQQERDAYVNELRKILDPALRKDALKMWREICEVNDKELASTQAE